MMLHPESGPYKLRKETTLLTVWQRGFFIYLIHLESVMHLEPLPIVTLRLTRIILLPLQVHTR